MTNMDLFREIGMIDEKYIIEAEETKRSVIASPIWRRSLATAACLCLCVGLYFGVQRLGFFNKTSDSMNTAEMTAPDAREGMVENHDLETAAESVETAEGIEEYATTINTEEEKNADRESLDETKSDKTEAANQSAVYDSLSADSNIRDLTSICERFAGYPNTSDELVDAGLVVNLHGNIKGGKELLDAFIGSVEAGTEASVELVQFTVEGDAMFYYIDYDGTDFYAVIDYSRDEFAGSGERVHEYRYKYLKIFEESIEGGKRVEILLTDTEDLTVEEDRGRDESLYIMSYTE